jgi:membrane protein required for colicin V production
MNWVDVVIVIILIIGLFKGLANGFVRGLFGLVALVLGIAIAAGYYAELREALLFRLPMGLQSQNIMSFLLIFLIVMLLVSILGNILSRALKLAALGWIDRLAGGVLGVFMACLFVGAILLVVVMAGFHENNAVARSTVAPAVVSVMDAAIVFAPEEARFRIEEQYLKLRAEWERARQEPEEEEEGESEEGGTFASVLPPDRTGAPGLSSGHSGGRLTFGA